MKIILLLILLASFSSGDILSQISWYPYNTGASGKINSIYFINTNTGYCCSEDGKILKTTNTGFNWSVQYSNSLFQFKCITFTSSLIGYVSVFQPGINRDYLYNTTNSGTNWQFLYKDTIPIGAHFGKITFLNTQTGYALYGSISKTTNAGVNWYVVKPQAMWEGITDIFFINDNTGWCANWYEDLGHLGTLYKTTNGAANWNNTAFLYQGNDQHTEFRLYFFDANTGFMSVTSMYYTRGVIRKTSNSGQTWTTLDSNSNLYKCIYFRNAQTGYLGANGNIRTTYNGGAAWSNNLLAGNIYAITFTDQLNGFAASDNGIIYKTTNGGLTPIQKIDEPVPVNYKLYQNYPNPFNPNTKIKFNLPNSFNGEAMEVSLKVYDAIGRMVTDLTPSLRGEVLSPGTYEVEWPAPSGNTSEFTSGVYFYRLTAGVYIDTKKMILIK